MCSASYLCRCVLQSKTLNDCVAISQLHRNFAFFQELQSNFRILHVNLHFLVSPFVPSPVGSPQFRSVSDETAELPDGVDLKNVGVKKRGALSLKCVPKD